MFFRSPEALFVGLKAVLESKGAVLESNGAGLKAEGFRGPRASSTGKATGLTAKPFGLPENRFLSGVVWDGRLEWVAGSGGNRGQEEREVLKKVGGCAFFCFGWCSLLRSSWLGRWAGAAVCVDWSVAPHCR